MLVGQRFGDRSNREIAVGLSYKSSPNKISYTINARFDLFRHSIKSRIDFDWGRDCVKNSGLQLAVALVHTCFYDDELTKAIYREVYDSIVLQLDSEWVISRDEMQEKIAAIAATKKIKATEQTNYGVVNHKPRQLTLKKSIDTPNKTGLDDLSNNDKICKYCQKEFKSASGKTLHEKACKPQDGQDDTLRCRHCGKKVNSTSGRTLHEKTCKSNN